MFTQSNHNRSIEMQLYLKYKIFCDLMFWKFVCHIYHVNTDHFHQNFFLIRWRISFFRIINWRQNQTRKTRLSKDFIHWSFASWRFYVDWNIIFFFNFYCAFYNRFQKFFKKLKLINHVKWNVDVCDLLEFESFIDHFFE